MTKIALGLIIWSLVHFLRSIAPGFRQSMIDRIGEYPWKGLVTVALVFAVYLMVAGWGDTTPEFIYIPPAWGGEAALVLILAGFILFFAPYQPNNFRRLMRHPQLAGMMCWGIGHLMANGEQRSILLFAGLTAWAFVQILLINRREGAWEKPEPAPRLKDINTAVLGALFFVVMMFTHVMLFGVSPAP